MKQLQTLTEDPRAGEKSHPVMERIRWRLNDIGESWYSNWTIAHIRRVGADRGLCGVGIPEWPYMADVDDQIPEGTQVCKRCLRYSVPPGVPDATALCGCGCGGVAPLVIQTARSEGVTKGQQRRFIRGHNAKMMRRTVGYSQVYVGNGRGRDAHVVIAERALGRRMPAGAEVHHVDGNKHNNARTNLVICQDRAYHFLLHARARVVRAGGDPNTQRVCGQCGRLRKLTQIQCYECQRERRVARLAGVR